jgi:hypothetical protein
MLSNIRLLDNQDAKIYEEEFAWDSFNAVITHALCPKDLAAALSVAPKVTFIHFYG